MKRKSVQDLLLYWKPIKYWCPICNKEHNWNGPPLAETIRRGEGVHLECEGGYIDFWIWCGAKYFRMELYDKHKSKKLFSEGIDLSLFEINYYGELEGIIEPKNVSERYVILYKWFLEKPSHISKLLVLFFEQSQDEVKNFEDTKNIARRVK